MILIALGIIVFILLIAFVVMILLSLLKNFKKFYLIQKIAGDKKWKLNLFAGIPVILLVIFGFINFINTIIVALHLAVFFLFFNTLGKVLKKCFHLETKYYWQGVLTLLVTVAYFSVGWYNAQNVWETNYKLETKKDLGMDSLRVVQISDSHLGATFHWQKFEEHLQRIQKTNPDLIVITGDYVDDDSTKEDMIRCCEALGKMKTTYGVYVIYGNHDKGYMNYRNFTLEDMEKEFEKNHIKLLEDEVELIDNKFYLIGRRDRSVQNRKTAKELVENLDHSKYMIMLDHQPNDYDNEAEASVDLVLSGHTHGGQMIPIGITGELSGANDKTYGLETRKNTTFIVNSGISDWAIQFKTGTFSEYGVIDIE
jgi:predicted MPP superfamily phosphohydrolase